MLRVERTQSKVKSRDNQEQEEKKMGGCFLVLASQLELFFWCLNKILYLVDESLNSFGSKNKGHFLPPACILGILG